MTDYTELNPNERIVNNMDDALRLVEKGLGTRKLLVYQSNLHPDFFDLSIGLAGEVLQKLVNYQIKAAFVVDLESIRSEYFKQMANESELRDDFKFFNSKFEAMKWF